MSHIVFVDRKMFVAAIWDFFFAGNSRKKRFSVCENHSEEARVMEHFKKTFNKQHMAWSSSNCKYYSYFLSYKKKLLPGQSNHAGDFFFLLLARQNIPNHYLTVKMCLKRFRPKSIFKPFTRINVGKVFLFHFFFQLYFSLSSGFQLQTLTVPCL